VYLLSEIKQPLTPAVHVARRVRIPSDAEFGLRFSRVCDNGKVRGSIPGMHFTFYFLELGGFALGYQPLKPSGKFGCQPTMHGPVLPRKNHLVWTVW
jgi:hypothetical protein